MNILLHICCSNCSLYPVKILRSEKHDFTGFWFNPNIHPYEEHNSRLDSLKRLASEWKFDVSYMEEYKPGEYLEMFNLPDAILLNAGLSSSNGSNGLSDLSGLNVPPPPERCKACYQLRLEKTAEHAREKGFDAFSTTLLISPYQNFEQIVSTGKELAEKYNVLFHINDYRPHFWDAMALSKELGLYRQKYCGCIFSREERVKESKSQEHKGAK
ncbi:MAG: epoxyqueuosine reductase QueH [Nitrospirae bacterium]|nr:epoxyqueuosine reductase QueH [Nitrospirota bacterium]